MPTRRPDWLRPLLLALACAVATWWSHHFFVMTWRGQLYDTVAYLGSDIGDHLVRERNERLLEVVSVAGVALAMLAVAVIALLRRRWVLALEACGVIAAANVTTRVLKFVLWPERPDLVVQNGTLQSVNSLPSGHTTAAASACVAALLVVWPRLRVPTALAGAAIMVLFGWSTMAAHWHRASDVVAALCVSFGWGFAALATQALRRTIRGRPDQDPSHTPARRQLVATPSSGWAVLLATGGLAALVVAGWAAWHLRHLTIVWVERPQYLLAYGGATAGVVATALIGMAALLRLVQLSDLTRPERGSTTPR